MMHEPRLRGKDALPAAGAQPQTECNVLIGRVVVLGEAANCVEFTSFDHQAGGCDCRDLMGAGERARVAVAIGGRIPHDVVGGAARTEDDAGMLHSAVWIEQQRTDRSNAW